MALLIRLIFILLGRPVRTRRRLTEVSKAIDLIPTSKATRWLFGSLLYLVTIIITIAVIAFFRWNEVTHELKNIVALFVAMLWVGVGPPLTWYYETFVLPQF